MLCEIHRRKTSQPQVSVNHQHHNHPSMGASTAAPGFFPFSAGRASISPSDSDEQANWYESSPLSSPRAPPACGSASALSEDNERLRRSNSILLSELAHMRKLYNDIIYFVQNHVRPVTPSNSFPSSLMICNPSAAVAAAAAANTSPHLVQKPLHQLLGFHKSLPKQAHVNGSLNSSSTSSSSLTMFEEPNNSSRPKLFGVPLHSKKRLHPEPTSPSMEHDSRKARLVLAKEDLGLNLMPPSPC